MEEKIEQPSVVLRVGTKQFFPRLMDGLRIIFLGRLEIRVPAETLYEYAKEYERRELLTK